jgi:hypothetical protein
MRIAILFVVLMALSFGGGYWLEHQEFEAAQAQVKTTAAQLTDAENTLRFYRLQGQLLTLVDETGNKNYGDAAGLSTKFFNDLRDDASIAAPTNVKSALQTMLGQRDAVTADLAKGDPAAHDLLVQMSAELRQVLNTTGAPGPASAH